MLNRSNNGSKLHLSLPGYNMVFDRTNGNMVRWGDTLDDDAEMCPIGPELLDVEISTVCHGIGKTRETAHPCSWCYKSNTSLGENMSFDTFRKIFDKMPESLTQIAFGIGDIDGNPDLFRIMRFCRSRGVIPNVTVNGMGVVGEVSRDLAEVCGAVAVSHYGIDDVCFDAIEALSDAGLKQVNIHKLLSNETYDECKSLIGKIAAAKDGVGDKRLAGLRAIVFLLLKPKGNRNRMTPVSDARHAELLSYAMERHVVVGMDSCSAPAALKSLPESTRTSVEPCESTLFSLYINVKGEAFPCSFTERTPGWEEGIDLVVAKDFKSVWYDERITSWRKRLQTSSSGCTGCDVQRYCRSCPTYPEITECKKLYQIKPLGATT